MRIKWIDNAKGIAILLVIIGHVTGGLQGLINFDFVFGIHLVAFFLLSGYTLKKKDITREYLNSKFSRLMVPYFITCLAVTIADILNSGILNHDFTIKTITAVISRDLLRSFFASGSITNFGSIELGTRIGAIWFFPALFFAHLFAQIVINKYEENKRKAFFTLAVLAIFSYVSSRFIWLPFSIQSGMMASLFLYIGYLLREKQTLQKIKWYHYIMAFFVVLVLGIKYGYSYMGFARADCIDLLISTIVGLAGSTLIYGLSILYKGRILVFVGKKSLTILCTHLFAMETMGRYFGMIEDWYGITGNTRIWIWTIMHILFAVITAVIIDSSKHIISTSHEKMLERWTEPVQKRDTTIDIVKGIFIILMIVGHFDLDKSLRNIIFSCHMIAFIFLSGYCYNGTRSIWQTVRRMIKTLLLPYGLVFIGECLLNIHRWDFEYFKNTIIQYCMGVSFTKELFSWCVSVGPVYYILLLFVIRFVYILLDRLVKKDIYKWGLIICISLTGALLGKEGYWLPWSLDVACYCMIFFALGHIFREKGWLQWVKENHVIYFITAPIWVYMIYSGGMEIATRKYGKYALIILGSVMGVLTIYKLANYIAEHLPILRTILKKSGQATIIILMIHTLLRGVIEKYVSTLMVRESISFLLICTITQILLAKLIQLFLVSIGKYRNMIKCRS